MIRSTSHIRYFALQNLDFSENKKAHEKKKVGYLKKWGLDEWLIAVF